MVFYANHSNIPASSSVSSIFLALKKVRGTNQHRAQIRIRETTDGDVFAFPSSWSEQHNRCFAFIFSRVRSDIWRYGRQRRTKSQGQISWLCRDNSWGNRPGSRFTSLKTQHESSRAFLAHPVLMITLLLLPPTGQYTLVHMPFPTTDGYKSN